MAVPERTAAGPVATVAEPRGSREEAERDEIPPRRDDHVALLEDEHGEDEDDRDDDVLDRANVARPASGDERALITFESAGSIAETHDGDRTQREGIGDASAVMNELKMKRWRVRAVKARAGDGQPRAHAGGVGRAR